MGSACTKKTEAHERDAELTRDLPSNKIIFHRALQAIFGHNRISAEVSDPTDPSAFTFP